MQGIEAEYRETMQTDAILSQPVTATTPVAKLPMPTSLPQGEKNFAYHIQFLTRKEVSEDQHDTSLTEPVTDSTGEDPEPTALSETETGVIAGQDPDQPVDRDVVVAERRSLPTEAQAFAIPVNHTTKAGQEKASDFSQLPDINGKRTALSKPATIESKVQEMPSRETIKVEHPRPLDSSEAETGIIPMYQRGFVKQDYSRPESSLVGDVRRLPGDAISESPNSDRVPKVIEPSNKYFPIQTVNINSQQVVSEPRSVQQAGKAGAPGLTPTLIADNAPVDTSQFQTADGRQLGVASPTPVISASKEVQLAGEWQMIPATAGKLQNLDFPAESSRGQIVAQTISPGNISQVPPDRSNFAGVKTDPQMLAGFPSSRAGIADSAALIPVASPDMPSNPLEIVKAAPTRKANGGFLVDPNPRGPEFDKWWGNDTVPLAAKSISPPPISSTRSAPELGGKGVSGVIPQPFDAAAKPFFLDKDRIDDIPLLSKEGLMPNGPVRPADNVFTHPGTVRAVASQMVDALSNAQTKKVEIALNPEELGRVRMVLSTTDAGISVSILAERPETLDLMRRHIGQLTEEFRNLGYADIGFEFSGDGTNSRFDEGSERRQGFSGLEPEIGPANAQLDPEAEKSTRPLILRGLDMRL